LVLDFFAGSGTTAQAVLELNKEDGGNRKFILVQLPENTENPQFPTIAHITRERVRRVIAKLDNVDAGKLDMADKQDRGFRAFKLSSSNFKVWDADTAPTDPTALADQLKLYADNVEAARGPQDILFELILKTGLPLSSRIETITVANGTAYSIAVGNLLICLENPVTREMLRAMTALKPTQMLCLDTAFHGDDALKTNTVLETRAHGIIFKTV
jgi:adenine-specific DNA-methyltransferase